MPKKCAPEGITKERLSFWESEFYKQYKERGIGLLNIISLDEFPEDVRLKIGVKSKAAWKRVRESGRPWAVVTKHGRKKKQKEGYYSALEAIEYIKSLYN